MKKKLLSLDIKQFTNRDLGILEHYKKMKETLDQDLEIYPRVE